MIDERYVEIFNLVKAYPNPFGDEIKVVDGFELKVPEVMSCPLSDTQAVVSRRCLT